MDHKEDKEEFPSIDKQLNNLSKFVFEMSTDIFSEGNFNVFVDDETKKNRMDICKKCEFFSARQERCKKCGCWLDHKTKFSASTCPIDKW